ncbi:MAG: class I SAM-dependent methyltransferase [Candidatus Aceula lacicola]|nr:class I SAM-dependent methyltransferase [Candidatus Aceula lacicola]
MPSYIPKALAQSALGIPAPGMIVSLSQQFTPAILRGLQVFPKDPLRFDFIVDRADSELKNKEFTQETEKLIRYFLASLTIPEKDLWVNLSPYEQDRIIPDTLGKTEMGKDMLVQDYLLKQITASLIHPDGDIGKGFWDRIYKSAYDKYGTTQIPVDTFNKVWIIPQKAVVYEVGDRAFVLESTLKVMLEEDYVALSKGEAKIQSDSDNKLASEIVREIVIPELEKEVNYGKNFSQLRQIYQSMILATWFKKKLKGFIVNRIYSDQKKIEGVDLVDSKVSQEIYEEYLKAFEKGVCDFIKVEHDPYTNKNIPRKYFSGGIEWVASSNIEYVTSFSSRSPAWVTSQGIQGVEVNLKPVMSASPIGIKNKKLNDLASYLIKQGNTLEDINKVVLILKNYDQIYIDVGTGQAGLPLEIAEKNPKIGVITIDSYSSKGFYYLYANQWKNRELDAQKQNLDNLVVLKASFGKFFWNMPYDSIDYMSLIAPAKAVENDFEFYRDNSLLKKKMKKDGKIYYEPYKGAMKLKEIRELEAVRSKEILGVEIKKGETTNFDSDDFLYVWDLDRDKKSSSSLAEWTKISFDDSGKVFVTKHGTSVKYYMGYDNYHFSVRNQEFFPLDYFMTESEIKELEDFGLKEKNMRIALADEFRTQQFSYPLAADFSKGYLEDLKNIFREKEKMGDWNLRIYEIGVGEQSTEFNEIINLLKQAFQEVIPAHARARWQVDMMVCDFDRPLLGKIFHSKEDSKFLLNDVPFYLDVHFLEVDMLDSKRMKFIGETYGKADYIFNRRTIYAQDRVSLLNLKELEKYKGQDTQDQLRAKNLFDILKVYLATKNVVLNFAREGAHYVIEASGKKDVFRFPGSQIIGITGHFDDYYQTTPHAYVSEQGTGIYEITDSAIMARQGILSFLNYVVQKNYNILNSFGKTFDQVINEMAEGTDIKEVFVDPRLWLIESEEEREYANEYSSMNFYSFEKVFAGLVKRRVMESLEFLFKEKSSLLSFIDYLSVDHKPMTHHLRTPTGRIQSLSEGFQRLDLDEEDSLVFKGHLRDAYKYKAFMRELISHWGDEEKSSISSSSIDSSDDASGLADADYQAEYWDRLKGKPSRIKNWWTGERIMLSVVSADKDTRQRVIMQVSGSLRDVFGENYKEKDILFDGAGQGHLARDLMDQGFKKIKAIDVSSENVASAENRNVDIQQASAYSLPFEDNSFDSIVINEAIGSMDMQAALQEAKRVLRSDGIIMITTYFRSPSFELKTAGYRAYSRDEIFDALSKELFSDIRIAQIPSSIVWLDFIVARNQKKEKKIFSPAQRDISSSVSPSFYKLPVVKNNLAKFYELETFLTFSAISQAHAYDDQGFIRILEKIFANWKKFKSLIEILTPETVSQTLANNSFWLARTLEELFLAWRSYKKIIIKLQVLLGFETVSQAFMKGSYGFFKALDEILANGKKFKFLTEILTPEAVGQAFMKDSYRFAKALEKIFANWKKFKSLTEVLTPEAVGRDFVNNPSEFVVRLDTEFGKSFSAASSIDSAKDSSASSGVGALSSSDVFFEEILDRLSILKEVCQVKPGSKILEVGNQVDYSGAAAALLGLQHTSYSLEKQWAKSRIAEKYISKDRSGSVKNILGEFSYRKESVSKKIPDHSQDIVVIETGALSDPYPESDAKEIFREALRVIKPGGKLIAGTIGLWTSFERTGAENVMIQVLQEENFENTEVKLISDYEFEKGLVDGVSIYEVTLSDKKILSNTEAPGNTGGIDFVKDNWELETKGEGIEFEIPAELQGIDFDSIQGFVPIIINIVPITNILSILGLNGEDLEGFEWAQEIQKADRPKELSLL